MLNLPLILLGSVLMLLTIVIAIVFMIAGVLRRSPVNIKAFIASGIVGLLMIALGVLPWGIAEVVGIVVLLAGGFALVFSIWLRRYRGGGLREEMLKVREFIRREHIKPVLLFLIRIGKVIGIILLLDVIGLWVFLLSQGLWSVPSFIQLLVILLLLEGVLIGAFGAFMFYGYSEYRLRGQAALWPSLARDQVKKWGERRLSQQKWGVAMLIVGFLLVFLGLLVSFSTSL